LNHSARFEQKHGYLTHVEIDEVLCLVSNVRSEVSANYAVPSWVVLLVKLLLDVSSNVLFDVEFFEGNISTVDGVLLHLLVHIGVLDDGFLFCG